MDFSYGSVLWKLRNETLQFPEFPTKKLWQHMISRYMLLGPEWVTRSEQAASKYQNLRRLDLMTEYYNVSSTGFDLEVFVFSEKKKAKAGPNDTLDAEKQALSRGKEFLLASDRFAVRVITVFGPCQLKLSTLPDQSLNPLWVPTSVPV